MVPKIDNPDIFGTKIVIVEDDISTISYYKAIFSDSGVEVVFLKDGLEFSDLVEFGFDDIDLIIMDYLIPRINGIDCTRLLRKEDKTTPVIMISAYYTELTKTEAFLAGCNEYILKPIYPAKILFLIEKYVHQKSTAQLVTNRY